MVSKSIDYRQYKQRAKMARTSSCQKWLHCTPQWYAHVEFCTAILLLHSPSNPAQFVSNHIVEQWQCVVLIAKRV